MDFKEKQLYYIQFYDHSCYTQEEITCEFVGWVIDDQKKSVLFSPWRVLSMDEEVVKGNLEYFRIIKSCIIKRKLIKS